MVLTLLMTLARTARGLNWHAPHDATHSVAVAPLPGGGEMKLIVGNARHVFFSEDGGVLWQVAHGDGLQVEEAIALSYHPGLAGSGAGVFLIGTERGVWCFDPLTHVGARLKDGMPPGDVQVVALDAPLTGSGPCVAITAQGQVLTLDSVLLKWSLSYDLGPLIGRRGAVAMAPAFDASSSTPGDQDLFAAGNGLLMRSDDGGQTWVSLAPFDTAALSIDDWLISAVELSPDYHNDHLVMVGRGAAAPVGAATVDIGEIWRSASRGQGFQRRHQLDTAIGSLEATPPGPSGEMRWFASGRQYPGTGNYVGVGMLKSRDGGLSWHGSSTYQDFLLEDGAGLPSGSTVMFNEQDIRVMSDYASSGRLWYVRQEGIFESVDEGDHWYQLDAVPPYRLRDLEAAVDARGERLIFGAAYGSGALIYEADRGTTRLPQERTPMSFNRRVAVSPQFARDGQMTMAGNVLLWNWQDPSLPPANADDELGWHFPPMSDPQTGLNLSGYPRGVRYSPHFDATGTTANADRTLFWFTAEGQVRRSEDNLVTALRLPLATNGSDADPVISLAIAPTYDANGSRTDAFAGTSTGLLYRLDNERWETVVSLGPDVKKLEIPSTWSRSGNPEIFAILRKAPYVMRVVDNPGNTVVESLRFGLGQLEPTGLALHPDFANHPEVFLSTYSSGVFKLDLAAPTPDWVPVGQGLPTVQGNDVVLSPNFEQDHELFLATSEGFWSCLDQPGATWQQHLTAWAIDNTGESVRYWSPLNPMNPFPSHSWPWQLMRDYQLPPGFELLGDDLRVARFDQDRAEVTVPDGIHHATLWSYQGPGFGSWQFEAIEPQSGTVLATTTATMAATRFAPAELTLNFPQASGAVLLRLTALLQPGEQLAFDGFAVTR